MSSNKKAKRAARQLYRACLVDGAVDADRARQVAQRMAASSRRGSLRTLANFHRLVRLDRDRHTAVVESATPLVPEVQATIQRDLARLYGEGLDASFSQNPELIAGMRIKVGSDVYDNSVRAKLTALANRL